MEENPYVSPATTEHLAEDPTLGPAESQVASQGKRFLNSIIDIIVIQVFCFIGGAAVGVAYALMHMDVIQANGGVLPAEAQTTLDILGYAVGLFITLVYFLIMESAFQRTLGKLLTGTRVVRVDGTRPSFGQILGRSFARFIPFEAFSFLGDKFPVGLHDSLSNTRVVNA